MVRQSTGAWLECLRSKDPFILEYFHQIYGERPDFIEQQRQRYIRMLETYERVYGIQDVLIVRAPGRVNLIGMHIDHRGGYVNPIAVKEMTLVVGVRDDDQVHFSNMDPRFPDGRFVISEEIPEKPIQDWTAWTQEQSDARKTKGTAGNWGNYLKAPLVYLQDQLRSPTGKFAPRLRGMNILAEGTVPIAAGLSSSSTLVVSAMEATIAVNQLDYTPEDIVEMCGTAEWYIGTRGGKGDHAAIKLGRQGYLSHIGFFPLSVAYVPFPADYRVVVCHSHIEAKKSTGAKDIFNQRVAAYEIALMLLKNSFQDVDDHVEYFRDLLNPEKLRDLHRATQGSEDIVHEVLLYDMLESLPLRMTRQQVAEVLPESIHDTLARLYQTHSEPEDGYRVRGVAMFGLAECARSQHVTEVLARGDVRTFGELMSRSHDGDRISIEQNGERVPYTADISDQALQNLRDSLFSDSPEEVTSARLAYQPGAYAVSCEELDILVDTACSVDGVLGAGRIGAGLGGCISVLVCADRVDALTTALEQRYYRARQLPPVIETFFPVAGSGVVCDS